MDKRTLIPGPYLYRGMIILACLTLILAGLHWAAPLINQILLAMFLAVMLDPLISRLQRLGVPHLLSCMTILSFLLLAIVIALVKVTVLVPDLTQLSRQAPLLLTEKLQTLARLLEQVSISLTPSEMLTFVDAGAVVRLLTTQLSHIPGMLTWWAMVFLMLLFMLYELPLLKRVLQKKAQDKHYPLYLALEEGIQSVIVYARVKTLTGLLGGVIVWGFAHLMGLKFAFFWGILMFVFNYVPVLGSFLAAVPPVVQAFIQFDFYLTLGLTGFYLVLNLMLSSVIEPLLVGKRLDMALTTQLLAFLFWQTLLGITGAVLAIPLTYLIKTLLAACFQRRPSHNPDTKTALSPTGRCREIE